MDSPDRITHEDDGPEEEDAGEHPRFRFQFGISTLLYLMLGVGVICNFAVWLGLLPVLLVFSIAGGIFLGLVTCSYLGLGFAFENLQWDIGKCFIIATLAIIPGYVLLHAQFRFFPGIAFIISGILVYSFGMKIAWMDIEDHEIFLCFAVLILVGAAVIVVFSPLLLRGL